MSASAATPSATEELTRFAAAHPGRVHLFSPPQSHLVQAADGWLDELKTATDGNTSNDWKALL